MIEPRQMTRVEKDTLLIELLRVADHETCDRLVAHFAFEDAIQARVLKEMKELDWIRQDRGAELVAITKALCRRWATRGE